jgi:RNA polymerase sigma factor (sigma-70 family)
MLETIFGQAYPLALRSAQIRSVAAVLSGTVPEFERDDLEQEGLLACWRALPRFDANRASLRTFVERVVAARITSLHRARHCRPRFQPLEDDQYPSGDAWTLEIELRADVHRVLASLRERDRRLALALTEHTPTEASRIVGLARSTVYERIRHIRTAFTDAGLRPRKAGRL